MRRLFPLLILILLFGVIVVYAQAIAPVTALVETAPSPGDGATAPTIWLHPSDPALSLILGTDDNEGLGVYRLDGMLVEFISDIGATSNVDLRYNFPYDDEAISLIAVGIKDEPLVRLYTVDASTLELIEIGVITTILSVNGVCMYHSSLTGTYYVFVNSESAEAEQYAVEYVDGAIVAELARTFNTGSETEGCVADDENRTLFMTEEENAIWRYNAEPEGGNTRRIVDTVGDEIVEQIEGLTLYYTTDRTGGYLIAANEQADAFLVYERTGDNALIGQFSLEASETVDRVSEPNGMDVVNIPVNDLFPQGLFVTSDDNNSNPNGDTNFKLASWGEIATALGLEVDVTYDHREVGGAVSVNDVVVREGVVTVTAQMETAPVPSGTDAADDPAIWIHPTDTNLSTFIGTDKTAGLVVYNVDGSLLQTINLGRVNNVDLRYNFALGGESVALVTATNRTYNSLEIYRVNPETRQIENVAAERVISDVSEVYGICMYVSPVNGETYAFINSADTGEVEQYRLFDNGAGQVSAELVREFVVGSQTEGCVVDDANQTLYIGEEAVGVWRYGAEPDAGEDRIQVDTSAEGGHLTADTEGMAIYFTGGGGGYLIVSSQGSSEFVVYERAGANAYVGTFVVVETDSVDAVSGSDGLDVTNFPLGDTFPNGAFITQDDLNLDPEDNQNFKVVSWDQIAEALGLVTDTTFDPRAVDAR